MAEALGLTDVRSHDMRRIEAAMLTSGRTDMARFLVSQVLDHTSDTDGSAAVTAVHDRAGDLPRKRRALDAWAVGLERLVAVTVIRASAWRDGTRPNRPG